MMILILMSDTIPIQIMIVNILAMMVNPNYTSLTKINNTKKRELRNRKKLKTVSNRYRVSIFRSLKNISAQIIDDKEKKTLVSVSSIEKEIRKNKKKKSEASILLGEILAKRAAEKKITKVYFDRGSYKYHGRIKAFADALRKGGLVF